MNIKIIFLCAAALMLHTALVKTDAFPEKRVAVLEFSANNINESYAQALRNKIEIALYKKELHVLERKNISRVLFETGKGSKCRDDGCAVIQGKMVSADYVVLGDITFAGRYLVTVRIVDVVTGMILFADSASIEDREDILDASQKLADRLAVSLGKKVEKDASQETRGAAGNRPAGNCRAVFGIQGGYLLPVAFLGTKAGWGYSVSATGGVSINDFSVGLKTGFIRMHRMDKTVYATIVPLMAYGGYSFIIRNFFISPSLACGASYNDITDSGKKVFEPLVNPGLSIGYIFAGRVSLYAHAGYYCIIERKRGIQFLDFGMGLGFLF
jgi:TolB-like protein